MAELEVKQIRIDGGTQARAGIDRETVREYMDVLQESDSTWPFPSVIVFYDGKEYWLADGFHRITAARQHGRFVCEADIRQGTQRDAVLFAAGANADHGLRRTTEDKRRAVLRLLEDAEWGKWSDREIARRCKVSHPFVAKIREDTGNVSSERVFTDKHGNTTVMDTTNIGQKPPGPNIADIKAAIVRFVYSQDDWPELAGNVFTTPLHNLRSYGEEPFDYFDRVRAELENGEGVANEEIRAAAREVWADRRFQSLADKDGRLPPRRCPRCQAEGISDLVGDDHWRCSNCGREYDSTGRIPNKETDEPDRSPDLHKRLGESLNKSLYESYRTSGVADSKLKELLSRDWGLGGGSSGPGRTPVWCKGGKDPKFWYNSYGGTEKPTLRGRALIDLVRELLELPYPQAEITPDGYSFADEVSDFVKRVETVVSEPHSIADLHDDPDRDDDSDQGSIFNSLKSMEWLIEEMMTQVESRPLLFALNEAVMAVRKAVDVAKELETAVSEEAIS